MNKYKNTCFNIIFPTWMLILLPITWVVIIPLNLIIDGLVIYYGLKHMNISEPFNKMKKVITKAVLFGFLSDLIGMGSLMLFEFLTDGITSDWFYEVIANVSYNPLAHPLSFFIVATAIAISGYLIYFYNRKFNFKKLNLSQREEKLLSIYMAVFTAPYLFLLPMEWFY